MFAWSTAGAALLVTGAVGIPLPEIIGAFIFSAFLIFLCGITGFFEKIMNRIPVSIASAMLAGILLHFALEVFVSMKTQFFLVAVMFGVYIIGRRVSPRFSIVLVLIAGLCVMVGQGLMQFQPIDISLMNPVFIMPVFSWPVLMSIGIPLLVVTMASQNLTGVAVMKASGYKPHVSNFISWSGFTNLLAAPFGGFTLNLSALTAAICMGPESHPDKAKRYTAAITSGLIYIVIGVFSGVIVSLFAIFPKEFVMAIAGLAMFSTVGNSLSTAVLHEPDREASMITFFVTASGFTFLGVGAAFWGLVAGGLTSLVLKKAG
jgi:benzoate membrane transport protein